MPSLAILAKVNLPLFCAFVIVVSSFNFLVSIDRYLDIPYFTYSSCLLV